VQNLLSIYPILFIKGDEFLNYHPIEKMSGIFVDFWERGDLVRNKIFIAQ